MESLVAFSAGGYLESAAEHISDIPTMTSEDAARDAKKPELVQSFTVESFNEIAFDKSTRSVKGDAGYFIKFYASWCPNCKAMIPMWGNIAHHY